MKVAAYMALHYGLDYMPYAIRSVIDQVDKFIILYARNPTYGHSSGIRCPESEKELYDAAHAVAGNKLQWIEVTKTYREGDHRNHVFHHVAGFDVVAVVDSDEIWGDKFSEAVKLFLTFRAAYT